MPKPRRGYVCVVPTIPKCDFCDEPGPYDFRTVFGPWAHGCESHWMQHRASETLGEGRGQLWITEEQVTA